MARKEMPPPETALGRSLTYRLHLLHKLTDQVSQQSYPEVVGLSLSDGRCLATVGAFGPLSVNELAEHSNLNKSQASRAAHWSTAAWWRRWTTPATAGVLLSLTALGRRLWKPTMELIASRNEEIFGCLSNQEQVVLSQLFDRLIDHNRRG
jgi:DNA-binding MarR family transcriptional regulator